MNDITYPFTKEYYRVSNGMLCSELLTFHSDDDAQIELIKLHLKNKDFFKTREEAIDYYKSLPKEEITNKPVMTDFVKKGDKDKELFKILRDYIVNEKYKDENQNGLFLIGDVGRGKTFSMKIIYNELLKTGVKGIFKNVNEVIDEIKNSFGTELNEEQIINKYQQAKILFLDDFGSERDTEFTKNVIYRIINYRYNNNLPTIISSNYSLQELKKADIELRRIVDRIQDKSYTINFTGKNKREKRMIEV